MKRPDQMTAPKNDYQMCMSWVEMKMIYQKEGAVKVPYVILLGDTLHIVAQALRKMKYD